MSTPVSADSYRESDVRRRLIVALDVPSEDEALRLADRLRPELAHVKVGLELFGACGPPVVRKLVSLGLRVFLDLKLHDIPNTVAGAVGSLAPLGVHLTTVHAAGGEAVRAAAEAAREAGGRGPAGLSPGILAVTVLTSHAEGELSRLFASELSTEALVRRLGRHAVAAGATGLVASPHEIVPLRGEVGPEPLLVIPGIRPAGADRGDQRRTATPAQALRDGADFLVVGRPITRAESPRDALRRVLDEMSRGE